MNTGIRYFAGVGCRRECTEASLLDLLTTTLGDHGISPNQLVAIASIDNKCDENGLRALAENLDISLLFFSAEQLRQFDDRVSDASAIVRATAGGNVAEACALAAAEMLGGSRAELIIPKCKNADATLALAAIPTGEA